MFSELTTKMKIKTSEVLALFQLLSQKAGQPNDYKGLEIISYEIGNLVSHRYLYDKLYEANKGNKEEVTILDSKLQTLLDYLGFINYNDFKIFLKNPIHDVVKSCEGTWINYVRQNSSNGYVLASPVNISVIGQKMSLLLKGPSFDYSGFIELNNGCLFCHFNNENGKQFHHVYKIGNRKFPDVLQGVFSGISTSNEPIAGRTLLVKTEGVFDEIKNEKFTIKELLISEEESNQAIGTYLESFTDNNIAINRVISYGIEDLID